MRNRFVDSILSVAAIITFSFSLPAQTARAPKPATTASAPDLSGVWGLWSRPEDRGKARSFSEATPNNMRRQGFTKYTLKPGDEITVTIHPAKAGAKAVHLQELMLNGKHIYTGERGADYQ